MFPSADSALDVLLCPWLRERDDGVAITGWTTVLTCPEAVLLEPCAGEPDAAESGEEVALTVSSLHRSFVFGVSGRLKLEGADSTNGSARRSVV